MGWLTGYGVSRSIFESREVKIEGKNIKITGYTKNEVIEMLQYIKPIMEE